MLAKFGQHGAILRQGKGGREGGKRAALQAAWSGEMGEAMIWPLGHWVTECLDLCLLNCRHIY